MNSHDHLHRPFRRVPKPSPQGQFEELQATQLFCPKCREAMPVKKKLLLVLPTGELHHYVCKRCGTTLGKQT